MEAKWYPIPIQDIPLLSIWMAADGADGGCIVVDKDYYKEDVIVQYFCGSKGLEPEDTA